MNPTGSEVTPFYSQTLPIDSPPAKIEQSLSKEEELLLDYLIDSAIETIKKDQLIDGEESSNLET